MMSTVTGYASAHSRRRATSAASTPPSGRRRSQVFDSSLCRQVVPGVGAPDVQITDGHAVSVLTRARSTAGQFAMGVQTSVRCMPAARPLAEITSAILRDASSIISSPSIAEPFVPPASDVHHS